MQTTDAQVRRLMEEMKKSGQKGVAAARSGMDRKTARKYLGSGKLPSEMRQPRIWRTRPDPFVEDWAEVAARLKEAPGLEGKTLFYHLMERKPGQYTEGQLRTFQRRVERWRAMEGPPQEVFFPQEHRPGEAMQTDFTWASELEVTLCGEPFPHLLCHTVLPYSNWEWATICRSESLAALRHGVQTGLFRLGCHPKYHQTDNSTAATHDLQTGKRGFNEDYQALMDYFGMKPRTIEVGESHQNGDVEAANGALKRRLHQALLLRGSRDFESKEAYQGWLEDQLERGNRPRQERLQKELEVMPPVEVKRLPEFTEERPRVSSWSTIRVQRNAYSVPSRLIGHVVQVRVYEDRLEISFAGKHQFTVERLLGRHGHHINYRDIIWSLVQKPGAFARYKYREALFPSLTFRRAYDALQQARSTWGADVEYLQVLHLAASTMESEVEAALELLLDMNCCPDRDAVKALVAPARPEVPQMPVLDVDLVGYDELLGLQQVAS